MSAQALLRRLPELQDEGFISSEQSERIRDRYGDSAPVRSNRRDLLYYVLGGVLAGLGLILLTTHFWYDMSKWVRTFVALVPMIVGQVLCWMALKKKNGSPRWAEPSAIGLSLATAAALILISRIHRMHGDFSDLLLVWSIITLGIVYAMRSVLAAMLYVLIISSYAFGERLADLLELRFWERPDLPLLYVPLLGGLIPFFIQYSRSHGHRLGFFWLCVFSAASMSLVNVVFYRDFGIWNTLGPVSLMCAYTLVPHLLPSPQLRAGPFTFIGEWNLILLLLGLSWSQVWSGMEHMNRLHTDPYPLMVMVLLGCAAYGASLFRRMPFERTVFPEAAIFLSLALVIGYKFSALGVILVNMGLIAIGVATVLHGIRSSSMGQIRVGMFLLIATMLMRFMDDNTSTLTRGLLFLFTGVCFVVIHRALRNSRKPDPVLDPAANPAPDA